MPTIPTLTYWHEMAEYMNAPAAWLQRLPSPAPVAWFALFSREPLAALDALLWESMYLDHDHSRERDDLLSNWVALIGEAEGFTALLDQSLCDWINCNWGKLRADTSASFQARVWSAVLHTVYLCSPFMPNAAQALMTHFPQRVDWLGRWSIGPGQDPLGAMLLAMTGYQTTRQLAPIWQRMMHLPDGIPLHHAAISLEGILQLPPENDQKPGVFRSEFAHALAGLAIALSYRAQRGDIAEKTARTHWLRLKRSALLRMPFEAKWKNDIALMLSRKDENEADGWVIGGVARDWLSEAFDLDDKAVGQYLFQIRKKGTIQWNGDWPNRAKELGNSRDIGKPDWRIEAGRLVGEQVRFAQHTGDTHACVRTLCRLSGKIRKIDSALAEQWARQAIELEPHNPFGYTTLAETLRASGRETLGDAARVYAECSDRFPDDVVARTGLAEVLKELGRLDESEAQYLDTIERFPDDVVARNGLAEVLKELGRLPEAKLRYEQVLKIDPTDSYARGGIHRLSAPTLQVAKRNAVPPDGKCASDLSASSTSIVALRRRRQLRYRGLNVLSEAARNTSPQSEEGGIHSDLTQAELVFEALAAGQLPRAREILEAALSEFPYSALLLTAMARLERMEAQAAGTALTEEAKQKVLAAPTNLRKQFPDMEPVYWLEHGLAYHALTDGQVRLAAVAESFDHIKGFAEREVNPHDPDEVFKNRWAAGVIRLTGFYNDPKALSDRISELTRQLDVREEEPVLRRDAASRWQPVEFEGSISNQN